MEENRCPVLRSKIRPLPIYLRWIVHVPERFHQRLVTHLLRIKRYLHHFRMPRRIGTDLFVRRIFRLSSAVSHQRFLNSRNHPELLLDSPKASRRKRCQFTHVFLPFFDSNSFQTLLRYSAFVCLSVSSPLSAFSV